MPKPSPLNIKQWAEIQKRLLDGEPGRVLAREFKISETAIRKKFGAQTKQVKSIGAELFSAEQKFRSLPISSQCMVRTFADDLHAMNMHMAGAGKFNSATAHRLSGIANAQVCKIDDSNPLASHDALQAISVLTKLSNEAGLIPLGLIKANSELMKDSARTDALDNGETLTADKFREIAKEISGEI